MSIEEIVWGRKKERKRRKTIHKSVKEAVWRKYIGINKPVGKCYVCKKPIHFTDFEVGHNRAYSKGGSDNINNLRAICRSCNRSMGTMTIEAYKKKYFAKPKKKVTKTKKRTKWKRKRKTEPIPLADVILK